MITLEDLKRMEPGTIFTSGMSFMYGALRKWVAIRGGIWDWAIYFGYAGESNEFIAKQGDKLHDKNIIRELVHCDDEAFGMYRY